MKVRPGLEVLQPYTIDDREWAIKLDANERPAPLPSLIQAAVRERLSGLAFNRYPDMAMRSLRQKIAAVSGLAADNVLIGNGSSELLAALCYTFGGAGRGIVYPWPSFSMYGVYAKLADSAAAPVALGEDFGVDAAAVLAAAERHSSGLIILCNPNNPTGSVIPPAVIEKIVAAAPCPVVVDEAYYEFYGQSALPLLKQYTNLIVVRTFSKAYGLAAARVGYLLAASAIVSMVGRALLPYHVNALSLVAAEAVYDLRQELEPGIRQIIAERERLAGELGRLPGITVYPSATNFLLVKAVDGKRISAGLAACGIGIRDFSAAPGLAGCLRITVGTPAENDAVLKVMAAITQGGTAV
ncbi:histidinol-phosphate transaminase [Sporolituus thermophilus]|uniref:Histidinol-phosphate aminotransferase n=1 Tax=Sporolituus thermophilus DSM 23256 TaxID=1123285 RepID=A0A1G7KEJ3_9FIRM|nr:histidinol-phosphate transaminase [Sporolituus thermophilus]SDF35536.1 histidinol-phosphate aminotransferase [Sporolituus thermophilus DSM 23256]